MPEEQETVLVPEIQIENLFRDDDDDNYEHLADDEDALPMPEPTTDMVVQKRQS